MAGPFYIDLGTIGAWNSRDGLSSGACLYGSTAFQHLLDTIAAGEIVYAKGTADMSKGYTVVYDANSGNLTNGEAITWHDGAGVVSFPGAMATPVLIELSSGNPPSNDDDITGTSSTSTITVAGTPARMTQFDIDTNQGAKTTLISFIGLNASWEDDGTRACLDAADTATRCCNPDNKDYFYFKNFEFERAVEDCWASDNVASSSPLYFENCSFHDCGRNGFFGNSGRIRAVFTRCAIYANSNAGAMSVAGCSFRFCSARDNGAQGIAPNGYEIGSVIGCLIYDNTTDACASIYGGAWLMNTIEGNGNGITVNNASIPIFAFANRITNNVTGFNMNSRVVFSLANYYEGNTTNQSNTTKEIPITIAGVDLNDEENGDTNEGYTSLTDGSEDLNLNSTASLRRQAIPIPIT